MPNQILLDELKSIIKAKGMKYTEQRAIIFQIILNLQDHLSAEEVYEIIKREYPSYNIGIATIYRALNFLEEANLITSISFGKDGKKYEGNNKAHHDHMICTKCGSIEEFSDDDIEDRQEKIAKIKEFKITDHSLQIYGICKLCQKLN